MNGNTLNLQTVCRNLYQIEAKADLAHHLIWVFHRAWSRVRWVKTTHSFRWLFIAICLAINVPQSALAAPSDPVAVNSIITEMLEVSGITREVKDIPEQVQAVLNEDPKIQSLRPEQRAVIQAVFAQTYSPTAMMGAINKTLTKNFDEPHFKQFIELHHQPFMRKFIALEAAAETAAGQANMQGYLAQLPNYPPTPERLALVQRLDQVIRASAAITDIQIAIARAITSAAAMLQPNELRPSKEELDAFLEQLDRQLRASLTPTMAMNIQQYYLYAYRDVSDTELKQYIDGYDNPAIQWCVFLIEQGLQAALTEASVNAIRNSNEALTKKSGGSI